MKTRTILALLITCMANLGMSQGFLKHFTTDPDITHNLKGFVRASDGNYITAVIKDRGPSNPDDGVVTKYDAGGNVIWNRVLEDFPLSAMVEVGGRVIVASDHKGAWIQGNVSVMASLDLQTGSVQWTKQPTIQSVNGFMHDIEAMCIATNGTNVMVVGSHPNSSSSTGSPGAPIFFVEVDPSNGNTVKNGLVKYLPNPVVNVVSVSATSYGDYVAVIYDYHATNPVNYTTAVVLVDGSNLTAASFKSIQTTDPGAEVDIHRVVHKVGSSRLLMYGDYYYSSGGSTTKEPFIMETNYPMTTRFYAQRYSHPGFVKWSSPGNIVKLGSHYHLGCAIELNLGNPHQDYPAIIKIDDQGNPVQTMLYPENNPFYDAGGVILAPMQEASGFMGAYPVRETSAQGDQAKCGLLRTDANLSTGDQGCEWEFGWDPITVGMDMPLVGYNNMIHLFNLNNVSVSNSAPTLNSSHQCGTRAPEMTNAIEETKLVTSIYDLNVYPNPAEDQIQVELPEVTNGLLYIRDMAGRVVLHQPVSSSTPSLNLCDLAPGTYLIEVKGTNGLTQQSRFIKN